MILGHTSPISALHGQKQDMKLLKFVASNHYLYISIYFNRGLHTYLLRKGNSSEIIPFRASKWKWV